VEGEHRGVAADRAGEQKFERARRAILPAHMRRLADDEFEAAALAFDEFVEPADRCHLDLDDALRSLGRGLFRIGAVAALPRIGDLFQRGKAIADFDHSMSPDDHNLSVVMPAKAGIQYPAPARSRLSLSSGAATTGSSAFADDDNQAAGMSAGRAHT